MSAAGPAQPRFLDAGGGTRLAYHHTPGRAPGFVFLPGLRSDMTGTKALRVEAFCRARGLACLRFDYRGHGASSGAFEEGTIGAWRADALAALDALTEGPQVLVGSSMGGWIMLLAARERPERIAGLVGLAAAPDFVCDLIEPALGPEQHAALAREGRIELPSAYDEAPMPLTRRLIEEARAQRVLDRPLPITCPVRLLHGMRDPDVPWHTAVTLAGHLDAEDVAITLIKDGEHRLSRDSDLLRLEGELTALLAQLDSAG